MKREKFGMERILKISKIDMIRVGLVAMSVVVVQLGVPGRAYAGGSVDADYVRSLAAPGKKVLVIEYYDGQKTVVARQGYASAKGFAPISPTDFRVDDRVSLHLFGVESCQGDFVNKREGYSGSCEDFARTHLAIELKAAKVLYCRAFLTEEKASVQDVTCWGYHYYPGSLDSVDNMEEQLLSIGALRLSRKADGTPLRPDLISAERIGRTGYGMWADARTQR
ncbi:hypothetical protein [Neorhizobium sp. P12A]|uniref:hypothetical protein n=1 Tax=Neorhizobium sp. P12A TaxID=2268027 RepID=UPI0032B17B0F